MKLAPDIPGQKQGLSSNQEGTSPLGIAVCQTPIGVSGTQLESICETSEEYRNRGHFVSGKIQGKLNTGEDNRSSDNREQTIHGSETKVWTPEGERSGWENQARLQKTKRKVT